MSMHYQLHSSDAVRVAHDQTIW